LAAAANGGFRFPKVEGFLIAVARYFGAAWLVLGLGAVAFLVNFFLVAFATPENIQAPTFGTAWAPYSDALGPWFEGGLSFLLRLPPPDYLYRPTVGLFWASVLAGSGGRPESIPIFFAGCLILLALGSVILSRDRERAILAVALTLCALSFAQTWGHLYISSTAVDMPSMLITLCGAVLLLFGGPGRAILAGSLCLGLAGAIRGPMLLAGPIMIGIRLIAISPPRRRIAIIAAGAFLLPIVIDVLLQKWLGLTNNGMALLYCVASDAARTWTPDCHRSFLHSQADAAHSIYAWLQFVTSAPGRTWLFDSFLHRVSQDMQPLYAPATLWILSGAALLGALTRPRAGQLLVAFIGVGGLLLASHFNLPKAGIAWIVLVLAVGGAARQWRAVCSMSGYVAGTLFLCSVGLPDHRLQHTFSFLLFLASASVALEPGFRDNACSGLRHSSALSGIVIGLIVFLYIGSFLLPSRLRDVYREQVHMQPRVALKLSDDARIDRSLYYLGSREFVYTRSDAAERGTVRAYRALSNSQLANESFVQPNAFLD
jgi:hypothetical protein